MQWLMITKQYGFNVEQQHGDIWFMFFYSFFDQTVNYNLMINNNPYIVPEKPLKHSKVSLQNTPLFPHPVNRRQEEIQHKFPIQMIKRPNPSFFIENPINDYSMRMPANHQSFVKPSVLQTSSVSQWEDSRESFNNVLMKQLSDKVNFISGRLQEHERRICNLWEGKKFQGSTNLSESTIYSYQLSNQLISKQLDKYTNFESLNQSNSQSLQKMKEDINDLKTQRMQLQQKMRQQFACITQTITQSLLSNFRQSLNQKFIEEEKRINDFLLEFVLLEEKKFNEKILDVNTEIRYELEKIKESSIPAKEKQLIYKFDKQYEFHAKQLQNLVGQYTVFKDHTFKNILITQNNEREIINLKEKVYLLQNLCEKRQIHSYQKYANVSTEKTGSNVLRLTHQNYLTATNKSKETKFKINEYTYFIDTDGFLLDNNSYYLLDCHNNKIRIAQNDLQKLQQFGMLK